MNNRYIIGAIVVIGLIIVIVVVWLQNSSPTPVVEVTPPVPVVTNDPANMTYYVEGKIFTLKNGIAELADATTSASKTTVKIFGEPVYGDLNKDGIADAAVMLTYNGGGSGTFYYAVLDLKLEGVYKSSNVMLLGDRIAPQTIEIHDGRAVYNFAERKAGEPMTTQPSVGKSVWINFDAKTNEIGEFVQNFEGESDSAKMTLTMKKWSWIRIEYATGTIFTPKKPSAFTLSFTNNNKFSATTDCNSIGGNYTNGTGTLLFKNITSTLMYCNGSEENTFSSMLSDVINKEFTSKGELVLDLNKTKGKAFFK